MDDTIFKIVSGLINLIIVGFFSVLFWNFKKMDKRIDDVEDDIIQIKTNYLSRFEKVNSGISDIKVGIARIETSLSDLISEHKRIINKNGCEGC